MAGTVDTWERLLGYTWEECRSRTWGDVVNLPYGVRQAFRGAHHASMVEGSAMDSANDAASGAADGIRQYNDTLAALKQAIIRLDGGMTRLEQTCG